MKYIPIFLLAFLAFSGSPKTESKPFVLVQLFTSQGCSSCPPADQLIERVKKEYKDQNVFLMSYHVDYWNRLGWKDPFSQKKFTEIQYKYAAQFRERNVYTPQIVVNGKEHFVGSNAYRLKRKIQSYLKQRASNSIELTLTKNEKENTVIHYQVSGDVRHKKLHLAFVLDHSITKVKSGENNNRTLSNSNIVIDDIYLNLEKRTSDEITISNDRFKSYKNIKIIAFVQDEKLHITGASQIDF